MPKKNIPQRLLDKVLRDYDATKSVFNTASRCGLGSSTVHRILKAHGIECVGLRLFRESIRKLPHAAQLAVEYDSGLSYSQIAAKYGCHAGSVRDAIKKAGISPRRRGNQGRPVTEAESAEMISLYQALGSQVAVAASLGTSQSRVSRALIKAGVMCSRKLGARHPNWKGGRARNQQGYLLVAVPPNHPLSSMRSSIGYVLEHRFVMAQALGRPLALHETVHHINGKKDDNRIENLQLRIGKHGAGEVMKCAKCGSTDLCYEKIADPPSTA